MKEYSKNGYIVCVGNGAGGIEISDERYAAIIQAFENKPQPTETVDYRLKTDLTWEAYEIDPNPEPEPKPDLDDSELVDILLGGAE